MALSNAAQEVGVLMSQVVVPNDVGVSKAEGVALVSGGATVKAGTGVPKAEAPNDGAVPACKVVSSTVLASACKLVPSTLPVPVCSARVCNRYKQHNGEFNRSHVLN